MLTCGSFFSGIGGLDLGFEAAGFTIIWQVEKDEFCRKVLKKNFPGVEQFSDVRETGRHNLQPVDVAIGGFPCQPHSQAGKQKGAADDRDLWPEYRRNIAELEPVYVVAENVPGIRRTILDGVLSDLERLTYTVWPISVPAAAIGAPHIRERIFIVAYSDQFRQKRNWTRQSERGNESQNGGSIMADSNRERELQSQRGIEKQWQRFGNGSQAIPHTNGNERDRRRGSMQMGRQWSEEEIKNARFPGRAEWLTEPGMGRVANGIPDRLDRLKALGNAVVPQQGYFIATLVARHSNKSLNQTPNPGLKPSLCASDGAVKRNNPS